MKTVDEIVAEFEKGLELLPTHEGVADLFRLSLTQAVEGMREEGEIGKLPHDDGCEYRTGACMCGAAQYNGGKDSVLAILTKFIGKQ